MDKKEHIPVTRTIARAVAILEVFDDTRPTLGVTEIGQLTGIDKSTVYRLLNALLQGGLIAQDAETSRYHLGMGLLRLAGRAAQHLNLPRLARPHLRDLASRTRETVNLSVLNDEDCLVRVDAVESSHQVRNVAPLGFEMPLHAVSDGKVLLAHLPDAQVERILDRGLQPFTEQTIVCPDKLRQVLDEIRQAGFGLAEEELEQGLSGVASPILNYEGRAVAAVGVSGPAFRLTRSRLEELGPVVKETAACISKEIGYLG